jgi:hypothetical protein
VETEYYIHRGVYVCQTEDSVILLDLHQDRYIGLDLVDGGLLDEHVQGWPTRQTSGHIEIPRELAQKVISELVSNQLLTTNYECANPDATCRIERPCETMHSRYCDSKVTLGHLCAYVSALLLTKTRMRVMPLHSVVQRVARRRSAKTAEHGSVDFDAARRLIRSYVRLRALFVTSTDKCLADSLTLVEFLSWYDIYPAVVFGVRSRPFAAHSWVQHGRCILNDSLEHVRSFEAILAA